MAISFQFFKHFAPRIASTARSYKRFAPRIASTARSYKRFAPRIASTARSYKRFAPRIASTARSYKRFAPRIASTARSYKRTESLCGNSIILCRSFFWLPRMLPVERLRCPPRLGAPRAACDAQSVLAPARLRDAPVDSALQRPVLTCPR